MHTEYHNVLTIVQIKINWDTIALSL